MKPDAQVWTTQPLASLHPSKTVSPVPGDVVRNVKTIYANANEQATLVCEQCGKTKAIDVAPFKDVRKPLKVKCGCGHVFWISIEVRKFYRKTTKLAGEYSIGGRKASMVVENLSKTGLGFRTQTQHALRVNDMIRVSFRLDNPRHSDISKMAVVKRVGNDVVGAAFLDCDAYSDTNRLLGFYLMSH